MTTPPDKFFGWSDETVEKVADAIFRIRNQRHPAPVSNADLAKAALAAVAECSEVKALVGKATEAAETIAQCVRVEHGWPSVHPVNIRRYERDMEQVQEILDAVKPLTKATHDHPTR